DFDLTQRKHRRTLLLSSCRRIASKIFSDEFAGIVLPKRHRDCVGSLGRGQNRIRRHAWSPLYGQHNVPRSYGQHNMMMAQVHIADADHLVHAVPWPDERNRTSLQAGGRTLGSMGESPQTLRARWARSSVPDTRPRHQGTIVRHCLDGGVHVILRSIVTRSRGASATCVLIYGVSLRTTWDTLRTPRHS